VITIAVRADVLPAWRAGRGFAGAGAGGVCAGGGCCGGGCCAPVERGMKSKLNKSTIRIPAILDRFLRYVTVDTTPDEASRTSPTTSGQRVLLTTLADELRGMGAAEVTLDEHGYVMATIPATVSRPVPTIGFIAHVDTSPEMPGVNVKPIVHPAYDGRDIVLPDAEGVVLRLADIPALGSQIGHDIVTASGATLLGADDKAGVAEIMTAAEHLLAHPEIPHGTVRIAFTPDEEIGRGADRFDVERFGAACAYTLDGGECGELEIESFSADAMDVRFHGFNTHPGYAHGKMVSAIRMAAAFIDVLPAHVLTPERSSGQEGYVHPHGMDAAVDQTSVRLLVRDFTPAGLREKEAIVERIAREIASTQGGRVELRIDPQYRNMREVLEQHPKVVEHAATAIRRAGLEVRMPPIRGGTDGSRLSFMGLPTPNLFAGQHNIHSRLEWTSAQDMALAAQVIVELCAVFAETS
jgi:tripeptide aminopeptidase